MSAVNRALPVVLLVLSLVAGASLGGDAYASGPIKVKNENCSAWFTNHVNVHIYYAFAPSITAGANCTNTWTGDIAQGSSATVTVLESYGSESFWSDNDCLYAAEPQGTVNAKATLQAGSVVNCSKGSGGICGCTVVPGESAWPE